MKRANSKFYLFHSGTTTFYSRNFDRVKKSKEKFDDSYLPTSQIFWVRKSPKYAWECVKNLDRFVKL